MTVDPEVRRARTKEARQRRYLLARCHALADRMGLEADERWDLAIAMCGGDDGSWKHLTNDELWKMVWAMEGAGYVFWLLMNRGTGGRILPTPHDPKSARLAAQKSPKESVSPPSP